jgi:hypothetical protein
MLSNFTEAQATDVTKNEKICPETRADDIKVMSWGGKIWESLPVNSD